MKNILVVLSLLLSVNAFSQHSLKGKVIDKDSGEALEFCYVVLYQGDKYLKGAVTDESGMFKIENVPSGAYQIRFKMIGFTESVTNLQVSQNTDLGINKLSQEAFELAGVEVVRQKQQVIYKLDKKIIAASNNIIAAGGGTATDILSRVPSIRVDAEGNVSFRGSSGFIVQVNGKPSMFNASHALLQIPASQIENIEIITTPSARNQTDGDAGIINIITKQSYGEGLSGAVNVSGDTYGSRGTDFTLNNQSGEHRFKLGGFYKQQYRKSDFEQEKTTIVADTTVTSHSKGPRRGEFYSYILQASWQLVKKKTDYYIDLTGGYEGFASKGDLSYSEALKQGNYAIVNNKYNSLDHWDMHETLIAGSAGFNHKFNKENHTLKGHLYLKYGSKALETFESNLFDESGERAQGHKAWEAEHRETVNGRLDYVFPYSASGKIETGYEYDSYLEDGDYSMVYWNPASKQFDYRDDIYNTFYFQQGINSLYLLANQRAGKFEFQAGVRGEHSHRVLRSSIPGADREVNKLEFFPSVHAGYNPNETTNFTAAYSRRINRPGIWFMEPYISFRDYFTAEIGNPDIKPEYINSFELSFKKNFGEQTLQSAVFHRARTDKIERLRVFYEAGITLDSMANVGNDYSSGIEMGINIKPYKVWNFTLNGSVYRYKVENKLESGGRSESSVNYGLSLNNNFNLFKNTAIQLDGTLIGPTVRTQGRQEGFFYADFGIRQQFLKGKFTGGLSFRNFLNTAEYRSNINTPKLISNTTIMPQYPLITLNIGHTFNNFKQRTRGREGSDFFEGTNY